MSTVSTKWSVLLVCMLTWPSQAEERHRRGELFAPLKDGYLKVSNVHEILYMVCGNPQGKPIFVLHGGLGFGCYPRLRQYFNPDKFMVVLHDQHGAGRSRPKGELRENTIRYLVADISALSGAARRATGSLT